MAMFGPPTIYHDCYCQYTLVVVVCCKQHIASRLLQPLSWYECAVASLYPKELFHC